MAAKKTKKISTDPENSVLTEAHGLVHGDRNEAYDHPYSDYARTVAIFEAWTGIKLTPAEGVQFMVCVKLSRMAHKRKRDNYVDAGGYLECLRMVDKIAAEIAAGLEEA